jgi:adenylate cyclase
MEDAVARRLRIADLVVDLGQASVSRGGEPLPLPRLSFDLLVVLARAAPDLVTHDQLMERVWRGVVVSPETISQRVKLLRDALGDDPREPRYVAGVRSRGYRLVAGVEPLPLVERAAAAPPTPPTGLGSGPDPEPDPCLKPQPEPEPEPESMHAAHVEPGSRATSPAGAATPTGRSRARAAAVVVASLVVAAALGLAWRGGWRASAVDVPSSAAGNGATTSVDVVGLPPRTVAVLPFETLSADPADRFIGLGVAEMVLNRLAGSDALFVLARSSSFAFEGRNVDAREIGRQLGARYLVQGSVQRAGDALRITAQLVDARSGRQMQALSLDRDVAGLFAVQDEIATQMAAALDVAIAAPRAATARVEAQLAYLQGLAVAGRWRIAEFDAAIGHFRRAREIDPGQDRVGHRRCGRRRRDRTARAPGRAGRWRAGRPRGSARWSGIRTPTRPSASRHARRAGQAARATATRAARSPAGQGRPAAGRRVAIRPPPAGAGGSEPPRLRRRSRISPSPHAGAAHARGSRW